MLDIFQIVKVNITTRDAVVRYGMHPNRSSLICCPFHRDKNPSMKVDKRFYCFGCGASGDVIDFVSQYFDLPVMGAAKKLVQDFGLLENKGEFPTDDSRLQKTHEHRSDVDKSKVVFIKANSKGNFVTAIRSVLDYLHILQNWKQVYAPKHSEQDWDIHFTESLDNLTWTDFLLDGLLFGTREETENFYQAYKGEIDQIGKRVSEIKKRTDQGRTDYK